MMRRQMFHSRGNVLDDNPRPLIILPARQNRRKYNDYWSTTSPIAKELETFFLFYMIVNNGLLSIPSTITSVIYI